MKKKSVVLFEIIKKNRELIISLSLNLILFCILSIICFPQSESGDDSVMMSIASGAYGEYSSYIVFSNIFYGKLIVLLNRFISSVNWYYMIPIILNFISFTCLYYVLIKKTNIKLGTIIFIILFLFLGFEIYINYQFTKTAAFLSAVGCFVCFVVANERIKRKQMLLLCIGGLLVFCGSLIRFQSFLATLGVFFFYGLYKLIICLKERNYSDLRFLVLCFSALIVLSFSFNYFDHYIYDSQKDWATYLDYNSARSRVRDYPIAEYDDHVEEYQEIGVSKNDYENLKQWNIGDTSFYSEERLRDIANIGLNKVSVQNEDLFYTLGSGLVYFYSHYFIQNGFLIWIILVMISLILSKEKKIMVVYFLSELLILFIFTLYLYVQGRFGLPRVEFIFWVTLILLHLLLFMQEEKSLDCLEYLVICMLIPVSFLMLPPYATNISNKQLYIETLNQKKTLYDFMNSNNNYVFLMDATSAYGGESFGIYDAYPKGYCQNVLGLGGWYTKSPVMIETQKRYGIANIFQDCIDNPNIYIVDKSDINVEITYIKEHYNPNVEAVLVNQIGEYNFYAVCSIGE